MGTKSWPALKKMYSALRGTKDLLRRKTKIQKPRPDNFVFRLHYQFTFGILAIATVLVTSYGYIDTAGSAIQCMVDKGQVPGPVINNYCWISATFTLPKHFEGTQNEEFIHHGVGPDVEGDEKIYHAYYQWVPLMLSMQAAMFYLPHWIWKQLEGGRFDLIIAGLNNANCDGKDVKLGALANYMKDKMKDQYDHKMWAAKFYFCEFLNFVNIIFQICITDRFLGYAFSDYGIAKCTMLVKQYWPMVAKAMFSDMTAKMVCEGLSYCDMKRSGDDFDCDTCKSGVMAMGQLLTSDDAANEAVTMLQGKAFCQDPGMGLSGDDLKMCQDYIANYIPKILKHMFNGFEKEKRAEMVCKGLFKVCPK